MIKKIKYRLLILLSFIISLIFISSCLKNNNFHIFTNNVFADLIDDEGLILHYTLANPEKYKIKEYPATFGRINTDNNETITHSKKILKDLKKYNYKKLTNKEKITYDSLYNFLDNTIKLSNYPLYEEYLHPGSGLHLQIPIVLSEYNFYSEEDVKNYLTLLKDFDKYFESIILYEKGKSDKGLFMDKTLAMQTVQQCKDFYKSNLLQSSFNERIDKLDTITKTNKNNYKKTNQKIINLTVLPTYEMIIANLNNFSYNTSQICNYTNGKQYYELLAQSLTGTSHSIDELIKMLDTNISNSTNSLYSLINQNPNILNEYLNNSYINNISKNNSTTDIETELSLLTHLQKKMKNDFPSISNINYTVKHVSSALEDYVSPAFFLIPPIDNFKENVIYINKSDKYSNTPLFTSLAHEGFPGHLYQNAYFNEHNTYAIRNITKNPGYLEGYASYITIFSYKYFDFSEELCSFAGCNDSLSLCLSARADIGIHYENWTRHTLKNFFSKHDYILNESVTDYIYNLILSNPANYLQYAIGYLKICELETLAKKTLKDDFSYKEFHTFLLNIGPAPFDTIAYWFNKDFLKN